MNIFNALTRNSWHCMKENKYAFARCSIFMNYVKENDIFYIRDIFPNEIFYKIANISKSIKYKNNINYQTILNIDQNGDNIYRKYPLIKEKKEIKNQINLISNERDDNIISLSEDEENISLNSDELIKQNDQIFHLKKSCIKRKKKINLFNIMLKKKRYIEIFKIND